MAVGNRTFFLADTPVPPGQTGVLRSLYVQPPNNSGVGQVQVSLTDPSSNEWFGLDFLMGADVGPGPARWDGRLVIPEGWFVSFYFDFATNFQASGYLLGP